MSELDDMLVGRPVKCATCGMTKAPIGRSVPLPMANSRCDSECPGHREDPYPRDLWPGEKREDFGYPKWLAQLAKDRAELERTQARLKEATAETARLTDLLNRDRTGLAKALVEVRKIACGFDWLCEGRGPYEYDDDRYRMEIGDLISQIVEMADGALSESGTRANEAFYPRAKETQKALLSYGARAFLAEDDGV